MRKTNGSVVRQSAPNADFLRPIEALWSDFANKKNTSVAKHHRKFALQSLRTHKTRVNNQIPIKEEDVDNCVIIRLQQLVLTAQRYFQKVGTLCKNKLGSSASLQYTLCCSQIKAPKGIALVGSTGHQSAGVVRFRDLVTNPYRNLSSSRFYV